MGLLIQIHCLLIRALETLDRWHRRIVRSRGCAVWNAVARESPSSPIQHRRIVKGRRLVAKLPSERRTFGAPGIEPRWPQG